MDSLTQIVLGASVAEAALGKKIGNKAIFLGAIAGTIPRSKNCNPFHSFQGIIIILILSSALPTWNKDYHDSWTRYRIYP